MTDELRTRLAGIIAGDDFPVYEHVAKADLIIEVVEAPLLARIAELEKMLAVHRLAVDVDALKARIAELEKTVSFEGEHNAELRDALEAQARRIAELENELAGWHKSQSRHYDKLHARIAELEAALKPFADEYDMHEPGKFPDDFYVDLETGLTIGQFRAARAALEKK